MRDVLENPVLFEVGREPWTLGAVCLIAVGEAEGARLGWIR